MCGEKRRIVLIVTLIAFAWHGDAEAQRIVQAIITITQEPLRASVLPNLRVSPKARAQATISVRANKPFHKTYKSYKSYENIA